MVEKAEIKQVDKLVINELENLVIKEKEKIVTASSQSGDVKSKEETIKEDIQAIYDLMAKNKNRIGSLSKKLKNAVIIVIICDKS